MLKHFLIDSTPLVASYPGVVVDLPAWVAPTMVQIRKVLIWIGTDGSAPDEPFPRVDVYTTVFSNHEPGFVVSFFGMDHYTNFVGPHQWQDTFEPGQIILQAGQGIGVQHGCAPLAASPIVHSHTTVLVWYEEL